MSRFGSIGDQYFDDAGDPLVSGKLYFYEPGSSTAKATYADSGLTIANANPVLLTAAGRQPNIFFSGTARAILTDSDGTQIEVRDPVGGDTTDSSFADWASDRVYNIPDIVTGSDGLFYISITDNNVGNDPTSSPANWTQVLLIRVWNTNETYAIKDIARGSDGLLYTSQTASNVGNNPITDTTNWSPAAAADVPDVIKAASLTFAYNNF